MLSICFPLVLNCTINSDKVATSRIPGMRRTSTVQELYKVFCSLLDIAHHSSGSCTAHEDRAIVENKELRTSNSKQFDLNKEPCPNRDNNGHVILLLKMHVHFHCLQWAGV